jgi:opacity protein-like surface antigen
MKKTMLTLMGVLILATSSFGQTHGKGTFIVDPYYGFPNLVKKIIKEAAGSIDGVKVSGIGPAGIRAEYMLANKFGLGMDFIYSTLNLTFRFDSLQNNGTIYKTYHPKIAFQGYKLHLRMNYHYINKEHFDAYFGFGAGGHITRATFKTEAPDHIEIKDINASNPFSVRLAAGFRYFFNDNIGLNLELGLGGPIISSGISLRF